MATAGVTKVRIEIGNNPYFADKGTTIYELTPEQYDAYNDAENAFNKARVARDKALGEPIKYPAGICNFWIQNIRLTEDANQYSKAGAEGDLNVIEVGADRKTVIKALFYPVGKNGYGEVTVPKFERLIPLEPKKIR